MSVATVDGPAGAVCEDHPGDPPSTTEQAAAHPSQLQQYAPHPEAAAIIRQVEFYLSDDNLPHDAHLLGLAGGDPNGPISLSAIMSFRKMKRFRPATAVREALRQSDKIEFVDNKHIRRTAPLTKPITVIPRIDPQRCNNAQRQAAQPWLTKGMLKKTGLEPNATEGPITVEEYERDRKAYDPEESVRVRLENAVNRFNNRRKMHQGTRAIFECFLNLGGIHGGRQFGGGMNKKQMKKEGMDVEEIEQLTAYFAIDSSVWDGMDDDAEGGPTWVVDFATLAKAFFSCQFRDKFDWYDEQQIKTATNVLRNFYNHLLLHDVCPEHESQIVDARHVCDVAEEELPRLCAADRSLPGDFNVACSTLHGGSFASLHRDTSSGEDWVRKGENLGLSKETAELVFKAGMAAYGTDEQIERVEHALSEHCGLTTVFEERLGLEVVRVEHASSEVKAFYSTAELGGTEIQPLGKLHCKRWNVPCAPSEDLPAHVLQAKKAKEFEFLVNDSILASCYAGMKIEAVVKELEFGIRWIDAVEATYPSFFVWLPNERVNKWREPSSIKERMARQADMDDRTVEDGVNDEDAVTD